MGNSDHYIVRNNQGKFKENIVSTFISKESPEVPVFEMKNSKSSLVSTFFVFST